MALLPRLMSKLPMPEETRLAWQRNWIDKAYATEIAAAREIKDREKDESLERDHRLEIELHDEKEDAHLTNLLRRQARRLRIPVQHRYKDDKTESDHWYEGHHTCRWYLTTRGIASLREDIRRELKARHEARSHWIIWLSAFTGLVGAITGLVALLARKIP